jgi:hypothetical protein
MTLDSASRNVRRNFRDNLIYILIIYINIVFPFSLLVTFCIYVCIYTIISGTSSIIMFYIERPKILVSFKVKNLGPALHKTALRTY